MIAAMRSLLVMVPLTVVGAGGCSTSPAVPDPQAARILAPTGKLRIGVYAGSPTSLVRDAATGEARGLAVDVGREFARRLGVPAELVELPRAAAVLDALKAGGADFAVTNATPARAAEMNFSPTLLELELGYLVPPGGRVKAIAEIDRPGVRVGVSRGSTSQATLGRELRHAAVVPAATLDEARAMLQAGSLDAFATNKAILHEMADRLPGATLLAGRWGLEALAVAIPKGREAAMDEVGRIAREMAAGGAVRRAAERAGLRGVAESGVR